MQHCQLQAGRNTLVYSTIFFANIRPAFRRIMESTGADPQRAEILAPPFSQPYSWFDFYDQDGSDSLDQNEVVSGILATAGAGSDSEDSVRETVRAIWPAFDLDGNGKIDREEFCGPGGMAESLMAAAASSGSSDAGDGTGSTDRGVKSRGFFSSSSSAYPGARQSSQRPGSGYPGARPSSSAYQAPQSYVPVAQPVSSGAVGATVTVQAQAPTTYRTVRVAIPSGMNPGQKLQVLTGGRRNESVIVTIPDRSKWRTQNHGQPFFDIRVPEDPRPLATSVVVQGTHANEGAASQQLVDTSFSSAPLAAASPAALPWQAWERFGAQAFRSVPLGTQSVPQALPSFSSGVQASGRRRAVLIGINYKGTRAALRGCVNDANNMEQLLVQQGFPQDSCHMVKLVDDSRDRNYLPTRANILRACQWLLQGVAKGDVLFFHYSGHGAQVPDRSGLEADGYNETILPMDYKSGQITDDALWGSLVYPLPDGVRLCSVMDCCHSGTGLDLPYECDIRTGRWIEDVNPAHSRGDAILFSGCEDSQTSADTFDKYQAGGAMTQSFIRAFQENPFASYPEFMAAIHRHLRQRGFRQRPQLSASQRFDIRQRVFSFTEGIEPNHNPEIGRTKRRHVRPGRAGGGRNNAQNLLFSVGAGLLLGNLLFD